MPSVARTAITWLPGAAWTPTCHWTHVWGPISVASVAGCHSPPSSETSTFEIPRSGAHATPATWTTPARTDEPERGTSIRDWVRIGASFAQPRGTQYASKASSVVSSSSASHFVAET